MSLKTPTVFFAFAGGVSREGPASSSFSLHPWLLFVKYYELKGGREYNESPARKLSDSFGLDIVNGQSITAKHILLSGTENS